MILLIDNYDSFVFNIARYFAELDAEVEIVRNDRIDVSGIRALAPTGIVLSPGPCAPDSAGISCEVVRALSGKVPILGVCLGHQCIGEVFGGRVSTAHEPMHGRATPIRHDGTGVFDGLPQGFRAGRYHSLIVNLPASSPLRANAWSEMGEIMGLVHRDHPTVGVQFHPESILTEHGYDLFRSFLEMTA
jgi:para-aminobenzoate synthetase component 2